MAVTTRDYYEVLDVSRTATGKEIQKAFRGLAKQYHPDVNKALDAQARFIEINEAYETLSDPQKRDLYDRYGNQQNSSIRNGWSKQTDPQGSSSMSVEERDNLIKAAKSTVFGIGGIISTFLGFVTGITALKAAKQEKAATTPEEEKKHKFIKISSISATVFFGILSVCAFANAVNSGGWRALSERFANNRRV